MLYSQKTNDSIQKPPNYSVFEGDTVIVHLNEIYLLGKLKFKSTYDQRYYLWFRQKVLKAYPFATLAADRLNVLNERLENIKSKSKKKAYTKLVQNYLAGEFTDQLKKLTRTEGRILIKLINRQTGNTVFQIAKQYRSGWNAFWYNTAASFFKLSLKDIYDPYNNNEDFMIEDILQRAFLDGTLIEQPPKIPINYKEASLKWEKEAIKK